MLKKLRNILNFFRKNKKISIGKNDIVTIGKIDYDITRHIGRYYIHRTYDKSTSILTSAGIINKKKFIKKFNIVYDGTDTSYYLYSENITDMNLFLSELTKYVKIKVR